MMTITAGFLIIRTSSHFNFRLVRKMLGQKRKSSICKLRSAVNRTSRRMVRVKLRVLYSKTGANSSTKMSLLSPISNRCKLRMMVIRIMRSISKVNLSAPIDHLSNRRSFWKHPVVRAATMTQMIAGLMTICKRLISTLRSTSRRKHLSIAKFRRHHMLRRASFAKSNN